ncbi:MAG: DUF6159 family protein [Arenicellales bacterium]
MGRFSRTWRMMGASWAVLKQDKELLVFPVLSTLAMVLVLISFASPLLNGGVRQHLERGDHSGVIVYAGMFLVYLAVYFVMIFFNAAIVACALQRMSGSDPTIGFGLAAAWKRLPQIFGWALVTSTVGLILRAIEERVGVIGQIVVAVLGMTWTVTSFLVVPVLVNEGKGPFDAYSDSVAMLKRSWGEQIIGNVSFGLIFMVLGIVPVGLVILATMSGSQPATDAALVICAAYLIVATLVQSTLQAIYQAAVYRYARNGAAPEGFDAELLAGSFRRRM